MSNVADTSIEAFKEVNMDGLRGLVMNLVKEAGSNGVVSEDLYKAFPDRAVNSLQPRLTELRKLGKVVVQGKRKSSKGFNMRVWVASEYANATA